MKKLENPLYISRPLLPSLDDLYVLLEEIWDCKWLTNMGKKHERFETLLKDELEVPYVSIFNNGAIALTTALKALHLPLGSEIITTPFTFAATPHCISWNNLRPVFCDINSDIMTIDVGKIEEQITSETTAILGVHVYGFPCDVEAIEQIANEYRLKVVYDAAHAFSTKLNGVSIGKFGDITMYSFHATKLFNTAEGGCLTYKDPDLVEKIYNLRNFGIRGQEAVEDIGINGKMNEIQAAIGLLNLKLYKSEKDKRALVKKTYIERLKNVNGIRVIEMPKNTTDSFQYFPIIVEDGYGISRDQLYEKFTGYNIFTRKYFYPLCSDYKPYRYLQSSKPKNLPVANNIAKRVLCLPFFGGLKDVEVDMICEIIKKNKK